MKRNAILMVLLLAAGSAWAQSGSTSYTNATVTSIPDGSAVGITKEFTVSGLSGPIDNVQLQLDITGGFTGDLYAYLVSPLGQMTVLLNRVGVDAGNASGYTDAGLSITLDGAATSDIHYYQSGSYTLVGGQLTGTWAADGRNVDPQSAGSVFGSTASTTGLSLYKGLNGAGLNGGWTLFIADLAGGGEPVFNKGVLTISTVPEPQTWVLLGGGLATLSLLRRRKLS